MDPTLVDHLIGFITGKTADDVASNRIAKAAAKAAAPKLSKSVLKSVNNVVDAQYDSTSKDLNAAFTAFRTTPNSLSAQQTTVLQGMYDASVAAAPSVAVTDLGPYLNVLYAMGDDPAAKAALQTIQTRITRSQVGVNAGLGKPAIKQL